MKKEIKKTEPIVIKNNDCPFDEDKNCAECLFFWNGDCTLIRGD